MAQPISNTIQSTNPFGALLGGLVAPKTTSLSGYNFNQPAASAPAPNMSTANGPRYAPPPTGLMSTPKAGTASTTYKAPEQPATSGVTYNPPATQTYAPGTPQNSGAYQASAQPDTPPVRGLFQDVASSLAYSAPAANTAIGNSAADIAKNYGEQIANAGDQYQRAAAGYKTTGTTPVAEGNANIALNTASNITGNLAKAEEAALQGTSQQLTGQSQAQSALSSAGTLTQPSASFPFVFNPATGSFSTPGAGGGTAGGTGGPTITYNPQTDSKSLASAVMNHQISYADALSALSYGSNGSNAAGQLSSAILNQGGNPSILQTQAGIQNEQEQTFQAYQSAHQQALNLQSQLSDLIKSFNLNPSDLTAANLAIQTIAKNTSDPRYQLLSNYVADVASRYSQILTPPGGSATDTTRSVASGMLNALGSGSSILDVMNGLDQQAQAVASGVKTIGANGTPSSAGSYSNTGATSSGSSGGSIQVKAADGQNYSFHQDSNGNWVAN